DQELNAMLLERCEPGTHLRALPEEEQDVVIAGLLRRLWRPRPEPSPFRPLGEMTAAWAAEAEPAEGLAREGLRLFEGLPCSAPAHAVLATDFHADNARRAPPDPCRP